MRAPWLAPHPLRLAARAAAWALLGTGLGLLAAVAVPLLFGMRPLTVLSGSMEPAVGTGDIVVVEKIEPRATRVNDIVTFRDPKSSRLITHRVRAIRARRGELTFTTKGDANNAVERWKLSSEGDLSRVSYRVPVLGYVLSWTRTQAGRLAVFVIPLLLLGVYELFRIWRPRRSDEHARDPEGGEVTGEGAA